MAAKKKRRARKKKSSRKTGSKTPTPAFAFVEDQLQKDRNASYHEIRDAGAKRGLAIAPSFAADLLGEQLQAGSWAATAGMECEHMAVWYHDYLTIIHAIAEANSGLIPDLLELDEATGPGEHHARLRGMPKTLDKILWWAGRERQRERRDLRLFLD